MRARSVTAHRWPPASTRFRSTPRVAEDTPVPSDPQAKGTPASRSRSIGAGMWIISEPCRGRVYCSACALV